MKRLLFPLTVLATLTGCRLHHGNPVPRLMVVESSDWVDLPLRTRQGLCMVLEDLAESSGSTIVPSSPSEAIAPEGMMVIRLSGFKNENGLNLRATVETAGQPERGVLPTTADPRAQLLQILGAVGLRSVQSDTILPAHPEDLLPMAEVYADTIRGSDQESLAQDGATRALEAREPSCAPAALARAQCLYRRLLTQPETELDAQLACARVFEQSLDLLPGYPRGAAYAGRFYTDTGNQRRAIELLSAAIARWPRASELRGGLAYAARTTGLLEGAQISLREMDALNGRPTPALVLPENTYLYSGKLDVYDSLLGPGPNEIGDSTPDFYRGYLRLLQGRRDEALLNFHAAARPLDKASEFQALALIYELAMDGHKSEALLALRRLTVARTGLRVPDGEFTFKLAEAFGFIGSVPEAMDTCQLAFSQGFGCTAWYLKSPMLTPLHDLPRWRSLISHLQDRQRLMERHFPLSTFAPTG